MARVRSPAYPGHSLSDTIEYARKIHAEDRQHPVDRGVAAQHMGFSGLTGTSDRALSSLLHYGLAEKAGKGEIRVTDLALKILHPDNEAERREALNEAGFSPQLFQELRKRYPGNPPAPSNLESYLSREGFASAAIGPATRAYLETCRFLEQERAYESDGAGAEPAPESPPNRPNQEAPKVQQQPINTAGAQPLAPVPTPGMRRDVFTLSGGGEVVLTLPQSLSQQDYDDLNDWLELMGRKAKRSVAKATTVKTTSEAEAAVEDEDGDEDDAA